jgi:magnesium-transporting ATPase (P-type)
MVTSIKDGAEDLQRARSDKEENLRKVKIVTFEGGVYAEKIIESQYIKAGDIVKLEGKSPVPVDMLLILTSLYEDGNQCYIETANIDGETNLKLREAPAALKSLVADGKPTASLFTGNLEVEPANKNIHNFVGALHLDSLQQPVALSADNLLLRSSLFSNTDWAYGIAIYTGQETKVQMNNRHAPSKMSKLEANLNDAIILIFSLQVLLVTMSVISIYASHYQHYDDYPYVFRGEGSSSVLPLWLESW